MPLPPPLPPMPTPLAAYADAAQQHHPQLLPPPLPHTTAADSTNSMSSSNPFFPGGLTDYRMADEALLGAAAACARRGELDASRVASIVYVVVENGCVCVCMGVCACVYWGGGFLTDPYHHPSTHQLTPQPPHPTKTHTHTHI